MKHISCRSLLLALSFLMTFSVFGQHSFRYQAVARDSSGMPIADQIIGVQISIIPSSPNNPPAYVEQHTVTSNDFGVINLSVGDGIPSLGDFLNLDWSLVSYIQVDMDITGGTNYNLSSTAEILSVPRALYALEAPATKHESLGVWVTDFGAKGDGVTNDTKAFKAAIDSAATIGASVLIPAGVYQIHQTLTLPDGVQLRGSGIGSEPLQTPYNGSLIRFNGNNFAIKMSGHATGMRDLVIADQSVGDANGGVLVKADGRLIESVYMSNVLITNFVGGTGLKLQAINAGGIAYGQYQNVRVRNAKVGYHIRQDSTSFVNSNGFYNGAISGGGFEYGIFVQGGNNNVLNGTVIEPPSSTKGHIVVRRGEIQGNQIRIEGTQQSPIVPLIFFAWATSNSTLTGTYAGGLTTDRGNNFINMKSGKAIHYRNSSTNLFANATFNSPDGIQPNDWQISGADGISFSVINPQLTSIHNVLKVSIPSGGSVIIEPTTEALPQTKSLNLYRQVNFGFHVKTSVPGSAFTATNAPAGVTTSQGHSGNGKWEFVGMNAAVNTSAVSQFQLRLSNTTSNTVEILVSTPTLSFGNQLPTLDPAPISSAGGQLNGLLTHALATESTPSDGFLSLPQNANYFIIDNNTTIARINATTADRFPRGSMITLLFDVVGTNVTSSAFLNLKSGFTSVANASLSLISLGNGTWREVDRNN